MSIEETRRERLVEELQNFQELAESLHPDSGRTPLLPGVQICGYSLPLSGVVGGDHLLHIDFNERYDLDGRIEEAEHGNRPKVAKELRKLKSRAGILVADVSGHRMTDALIVAMLHQSFLLGAYYELDMFGEITTRIFEHINTRFYEASKINKYFTMIYGEISSAGTFRFISAGHPPPLVFSREFGKFMSISKDRLVSFPPVGMFPSSGDPDNRRRTSLHGYKKRYQLNEINLLTAGDVLLLYTDGLIEHAGGHFFPGEVERLLGEWRDESATSVCSRLRAAIEQAAAPVDDITFVVIRKTER